MQTFNVLSLNRLPYRVFKSSPKLSPVCPALMIDAFLKEELWADLENPAGLQRGVRQATASDLLMPQG